MVLSNYKVSMALKFMVSMMPTSTDGVTGSTPETVLCKSLIHSYQIGKLGPNP